MIDKILFFCHYSNSPASANFTNTFLVFLGGLGFVGQFAWVLVCGHGAAVWRPVRLPSDWWLLVQWAAAAHPATGADLTLTLTTTTTLLMADAERSRTSFAKTASVRRRIDQIH